VFEAVTRERIIAHDCKVNVEDTDAGWYADHVLWRYLLDRSVLRRPRRSRDRNPLVLVALILSPSHCTGQGSSEVAVHRGDWRHG
jgi:hypothetical protein